MILWIVVVSTVVIGLVIAVASAIGAWPRGRRHAVTDRAPVAPVDGVTELANRVEQLESELEDLTRAVELLRDEVETTQRVVEDTDLRSPVPSVPPPEH